MAPLFLYTAVVTDVEHRQFKQPKVLYLSFLTSMCERFGYYIMGFLLTLYVKNVYQYSDEQAFITFGLFTAFGYLTPAIGGWLADNLIGIKRCLGLGLVLEAIGYGLLAIPTTNMVVFYCALGAIIVGAGIFKTAPTNILGRAYKENDHRIDSGFTLYYMGINIGSLASALLAGTIQEAYGWNMPFAVAAVGLLLGLVWFAFLKHHAVAMESKAGRRPFAIGRWALTLIASAATIALFAYLMSNMPLANICFYVGGGVVLLYFGYELFASPREEKIKIAVCLALIFMAVMFFLLYFQLYTSMELFIKRNVDRTAWGHTIPTVYFLGLNGFWIIGLSPLYAWLYRMLDKRNRDPAITTKFPLGILLMGTCFFCLALAGHHFANQGAMISSLWIVLALLLYSMGELLTSALGVAMITRIAPPRMYGIMMGAWYLIAVALAADLSGHLAGLASIPEHLQHHPQASLAIYTKAFFTMGLIGLAVSVVGFAVGPWLKRAAKLQ